MVRKGLIIVYILPVILSTIFAFMVIGDATQNSGDVDSDKASFTFGDNANIKLVDFDKTYNANEPIEIKIQVTEEFNCGDLYVTIYDKDTRAISENGFFNQCFPDSEILPIDKNLTERINNSGKYIIEIVMYDSEQKNSESITENFIVN